MKSKIPIQICVAVVIERDNKILLVKEIKNKSYEKSKDSWTLPAGKLEEQEDLLEATLRETKEETGYNIKLLGVIGIYQLFSNDRGSQVLGIAFKAKLTSIKKSKSSEFKNMIWTDIKEIINKDMQLRKSMKEVIHDHKDGKILPLTHIHNMVF